MNIERLRKKALKVETKYVPLNSVVKTTHKADVIVNAVKDQLQDALNGKYADQDKRSVNAFIKRAKLFLAELNVNVSVKEEANINNTHSVDFISRYRVQLVREQEYEYLGEESSNSPDKLVEVFESMFQMSDQTDEHLVMVGLDTKGRVIGGGVVHVGDINSSIVSMRSLFQRALLMNATSIAVAHNHPSGKAEPSNADYSVTGRMVEAGRILGVDVVDHIVIGHGEFRSIRQIRPQAFNR